MNLQKLPLISIITPSFNQAQFLEQTILSVLDQNYPNLEYIIIDGGSTDGSIEIIKKYEKHLAYWVSRKDNGQTDALKRGFEKSNGEIFAWINSDDSYLPGAFLKIVNTFQKNPKANLVFGNIYFTDEKNNKIGEYRMTRRSFRHFIFEGMSLSQPATFWKKDIYNKVGGLDLNYKFCMDFDFFIRVAKRGRLICLHEYLANFRIHKEAKTSTMKDVWQIEHEKLIKKHLPDKVDKVYLIFVKNLCRIERIFYYFIQGDVAYILRRSINRLCGISFSDEIKRKTISINNKRSK